METGAPITVYVNPRNPAESIVDRDIRWDLLASLFIFPVVFGSAGAGIMLGGVYWHRKASRQASERAELLRSDGHGIALRRSVVVHSDERPGIIALWFAAVFCNGMTLPAGVLAISRGLPTGNYLSLAILPFTLLGLGLLYATLKAEIMWRRFGPIPLVLDASPVAIGGEMTGFLDIPVPLSAANRYRATLTCVQASSDSDEEERTSWQAEGAPQVSAGRKGTRLAVHFAVPAGLPASQPMSHSYHCWWLTIEANLAGVELSRRYEIEMQPGHALSAGSGGSC